MRRIAAILAALVALVAAAMPAAAETRADYTDDLLIGKLAYGGSPVAVLRLPARTYRAGDKLYHYARLGAATDGCVLTVRLVALDASGAVVAQSAPASSPGSASLSWALEAPRYGSYTVELRAQASGSGGWFCVLDPAGSRLGTKTLAIAR